MEQAMSTTHITAFLWVMDACFSPCGQKKIRVQSQMHKSKHHSGEPGRDGQARDRYQTFRLTELEAAELAEHAGQCGRSVSQLVRLRVLGQPPPTAAAPLANLEMYAGLSPTASNLNQIAHHFNEAEARGEPGLTNMDEVRDVKSTVMQLAGQLAELRADLIGASHK